jgi:hypothetical protein
VLPQIWALYSLCRLFPTTKSAVARITIATTITSQSNVVVVSPLPPPPAFDPGTEACGTVVVVDWLDEVVVNDVAVEGQEVVAVLKVEQAIVDELVDELEVVVLTISGETIISKLEPRSNRGPKVIPAIRKATMVKPVKLPVSPKDERVLSGPVISDVLTLV